MQQLEEVLLEVISYITEVLIYCNMTNIPYMKSEVLKLECTRISAFVLAFNQNTRLRRHLATSTTSESEATRPECNAQAARALLIFQVQGGMSLPLDSPHSPVRQMSASKEIYSSMHVCVLFGGYKSCPQTEST